MVDVYLSPSVQHFNTGYGNYGNEEQRANLIADVIEYELERNGLTVARNSPEMSLAEIVADSNAANPRAHIAIHSNSSSGQARGAEIYTHRFGGNSETLALSVYNFLTDITPTDDLGVKESAELYNGQGLYENRKTSAPAILIEIGFHDNPDDAQFIIDNSYEIGIAIAQGIIQYFEMEYNEDTPDNQAYLRGVYNGRAL